jgi:hypothetical protein
VAVEAAEPRRDLAAFGGARLLRDLEIGDGLHEGHELVGLAGGEDPPPGGHGDDRVRAQLHLLGIAAHARGQAVEDPLADLALALRVHRDEATGEGRDLVEPMTGIGHAPDSARAVAGEAPLPARDRPAALDAADVWPPRVADGEGRDHEDDGGDGEHPFRPAQGPASSSPSRASSSPSPRAGL